MLSIKKGTIAILSLFSVLGLASCNREAEDPITIVNASANSIYGTVSDFSLSNDDDLKIGDKLTFKVVPNQDFVVSSVTVNGTPVGQVLGEANTYTWNLVAGENRVTALFSVDPTIDVVDQFKLNIDQATFNNVMNRRTYDFREDGVEEMDLTEFVNFVDGDTTHFTTKQFGYTVKVRYLGIDTPESTSELEEWGKSASLFNASTLSSAKHVILQSQGRAATPDDEASWYSEADTYGRNLAYVWYTTVDSPTLDDFRCLNLEMVYQGFSQGIGSIQEMGEYYYYAFDKANLSAQANKRNQYSGELDKNYYYDDPVDLEISEVYATSTKNANGYYSTDSKYKDEKTLYRFHGYVTRKVGGAFYFQDKLSYERGADGSLPEAYGLYVFSYAQTPIAVGDEVDVIGVLSDYGGSYQVSGISYHDFNADEERDTIIRKSHGASAVKPIKLTMAEFNEAQYQNVLVRITDELTCTYYENYGYDQSYGGTYELDAYNEKYPFYNSDNEIVSFVQTANNTSSYYRFKLSQDILLSYGTTYSYSPKFFYGGTNYYCPDHPEKIYEHQEAGTLEEFYNNNEDEYEVIKTEYSQKKFTSLTCISQNYTSTSGNQRGCSMIIAARSDAILAEVE